MLSSCRCCMLNQHFSLGLKLLKRSLSRNVGNLHRQNLEFRKSKIKLRNPLEKDQKVCLAYCTSELYFLEQMKQYFIKDSDIYTLGTLPKDAIDVLYIKKKKDEEDCQSEIFLFRRLGTFVGWNVQENEMHKLRQVFQEFELSPYKEDDILEESELMDFEMVSDTPTNLMDGNIYVNDKTENNIQTLEKLAFSNAMALSVRLSMWETAVDTFSNSMKQIPEHMKEGHKVNMSRQEVLRKIGELLTLRHQINLYSDLLATPDFFWDRDELEKLYAKTCTYLEVGKRTKVMNEKLNLCTELVEMLRSHLNEQHSHRLEWMIIWLITIEVVFEVAHWIDRVL